MQEIGNIRENFSSKSLRQDHFVSSDAAYQSSSPFPSSSSISHKSWPKLDKSSLYSLAANNNGANRNGCNADHTVDRTNFIAGRKRLLAASLTGVAANRKEIKADRRRDMQVHDVNTILDAANEDEVDYCDQFRRICGEWRQINEGTFAWTNITETNNNKKLHSEMIKQSNNSETTKF